MLNFDFLPIKPVDLIGWTWWLISNFANHTTTDEDGGKSIKGYMIPINKLAVDHAITKPDL